jgi:VCBS repeat-containing protein
MSTQFQFQAFNASVPYRKFDVIYDGKYEYATQDMAIGQFTAAPSLQVVFSVTGHIRTDDVVTVYFTQTGSTPIFQQGSIIGVAMAGAGNTSMNYTGMVLNGASGQASYINPGWSEGLTAGSLGTINCRNPGFTSGFMFAPTYSTRIGTENQVITTSLGNGYSQRMSNGLNSFNQTSQLVFQNRSDREARAMMNFVEDAAGVRAFPIMLPNSMLTNQPNHKYVVGNIDVSPVAFNLNDISLPAMRVFEP